MWQLKQYESKLKYCFMFVKIPCFNFHKNLTHMLMDSLCIFGSCWPWMFASSCMWSLMSVKGRCFFMAEFLQILIKISNSEISYVILYTLFEINKYKWDSLNQKLKSNVPISPCVYLWQKSLKLFIPVLILWCPEITVVLRV